MHSNFPNFLDDNVTEVAKKLLGCFLVRTLEDGQKIVGKIVETEAYHQEDAASHSFGGKPTARTAPMFGPSGFSYVYFTYGMHYCMNIVVGPEGYSAAVLIRAVEIVEGKGDACKLRPNKSDIELSNGPAKLCQAMAINKNLNNHDLHQSPLQLIKGDEVPASKIITAKRIGIKKAQEELLRFYITDNPFVSVT